MKLHSILYGAAFCCSILSILSFDGWMYDRTSLIKSLLLVVLSAVLWHLGMKEDGRIRKHR